MADSKYATLPGIAYDQPDVYESEDVLDNRDVPNEDLSEDIEKLPTNIKDAFSKFKDSWIYPSTVNNTQSMVCGAKPWNGPYELQAAGEKETPLQKLNRLKCEVAELEKDILENKSSEQEQSVTSNELLAQVAVLQKQLVSLKLSRNEAILPKHEAFIQSDLVKELQGIMSSQQATEERDVCKYELSFKPHLIQLNSNAKLANILERLEKLEKFMGANKFDMDCILLHSGKKSLSEAVNKLESRLSVLSDPHALEQTESRLGSLIQKLNQAKGRRDFDDDSDTAKKVSEAYDLVKKLEPLVVILPPIVERFLSLASLHDHASNITFKLTQIENRENHVSSELANYALVLKDVQEGLVTSMETFEVAVQKLNERIDKLTNSS